MAARECIQIKDGVPMRFAHLMGKYFVVLGHYSGAVEIIDATGPQPLKILIDMRYIRRVNKSKCYKCIHHKAR